MKHGKEIVDKLLNLCWWKKVVYVQVALKCKAPFMSGQV